MPTIYPSELDSFTNPSATTAMNDGTIPHHSQHANANDAIEALQLKVGVDDSDDSTCLDYKTQGLSAGQYTPTLTNVANLDGSTAYECQWSRVRDVVTVAGKVDVNPTAGAASTKLGLSLPIASALTASEQCAGAAFSPTVAGQGAAILGDATNDRAQMEWISADTSNQPMTFTFAYRIVPS